MTAEDLESRVADAIESAEFGWNTRLERLVDGVSTYVLRIDGQPPQEFADIDDCYEVVREHRRRLQARAVIAAVHAAEPAITAAMISAGVQELACSPVGVDARTAGGRTLVRAIVRAALRAQRGAT